MVILTLDSLKMSSNSFFIFAPPWSLRVSPARLSHKNPKIRKPQRSFRRNLKWMKHFSVSYFTIFQKRKKKGNKQSFAKIHINCLKSQSSRSATEATPLSQVQLQLRNRLNKGTGKFGAPIDSPKKQVAIFDVPPEHATKYLFLFLIFLQSKQKSKSTREIEMYLSQWKLFVDQRRLFFFF